MPASVRRTSAAATMAVLALALGACGDDEAVRSSDTTAGATTTTAATVEDDDATTTAAPAPPTSEPQDEVDQDAVPAEPADPAWQRYAEPWVVTDVAGDDVLNVRRGPGPGEPVVHRLAPDAADVERFDAVEWVDGARWGAVAVPGGAGWVNLAFLRPPGTTPPQVVGTADPAVGDAAERAAAALRSGDVGALADLAGDDGVAFSTDAFVAETDPVLSPQQLRESGRDETLVLWGQTDGEGAPIEMTIAERLRAIGDDFGLVSTDVVGFDTRVGSGNTIDNIGERFPGASVVEHHFAGSSLYRDFDWSSVRLVFDTSGGQPVLVGVVQDTWTI